MARGVSVSSCWIRPIFSLEKTLQMSHESTAWAWKQKTSNPYAKYILFILADCHNGRSNQCNPSISEMMKVSQISRRSVIEYLKSLENDGLITSMPRYGKRGRLTNQYALNIAGLPMEEEEEPFVDNEEAAEMPQPQEKIVDKVPPKKPAQPPKNEHDIAPLVTQIVLAHPRARQRDWQPSDVPFSDSTATLQAINSEVERSGASRVDAALMILGNVEAIAKEVPREQWKFIKPVAEFMRLREYRMEPSEFISKGAKNGAIQSQRFTTRSERNAAALEAAERDERDGGAPALPEISRRAG